MIAHTEAMNAYHWLPISRIVVHVRYSGVEVVQVHLACRMKFVEEVEQAECEGGARSLPRGGEPTSTEQLNT